MTWLFYALIAAVLYSAAAILAKMGIKKANPVISAGLCSLVMFICAFVMSGANFSKLNVFKFGGAALIYLLISGILVGVALICLYKALHFLDSVSTVSFAEIYSVLILWFEVVWWKNKIGVNLIVATVLFVIGLVIITTTNSKRWQMCGFAFLGAILLAGANVVLQIGGPELDASATRLYELFIATILIWIVSLVSGGGRKLRQISFLDGIYSCLAGLAVAGSWIFINRGYAVGDNTRVLQVYSANLIITIILASIILKERISGKRLIGVIFFVAGLEVLLLSKPLF